MKKRKTEFSKIIVIVSNILVWLISVANLVYMFLYTDSSAMAYLIPSIFTLASATATSYYWKAKNENQIKIPYYMEDYNNQENGGYYDEQ